VFSSKHIHQNNTYTFTQDNLKICYPFLWLFYVLLEIICSFTKYFPFEGRHDELYKII